ncbi:MAG: hypothetical protein E6H75_00720 [Betaproteobacteria bacterium]|nr:MAG: hypothetical protein E6H75_00720 [Betaproteobacteria bacterium]
MTSSGAIPVRTLIVAAVVGTAIGSNVSAQVAAPVLKAGESWTYREMEAYGMRRELARRTTEVVESGSSGVRLAVRSSTQETVEEVRLAEPGQLAAGYLSRQVTFSRIDPPLVLRPYPLTEGKRWEQKVSRLDPLISAQRGVHLSGRVVGWEKVRVPAGEFDALKIERVLYLGDAGGFRTQTRRTEEEWYVPLLKAPAKLRIWEEASDPTVPRILRYTLINRELYELVEYRVDG